MGQKPFPVSLMPDSSAETVQRYGIANGELLQQLLQQNDVIVPEPIRASSSIEAQYRRYHRGEDWDLLLQTILDVDPTSAVWIERVFRRPFLTYPYNMFVMPGEWFNDYMTWLFEILFLLEKRLKPSEDPYQRRVYGFMSERLFTLYLTRLQAERPVRLWAAPIVVPEWD